MNLRLYITTRVALATKRRRLKHVRAFIRDLEDQISSGEQCLYRYQEIARKLECQIAMLDDPADVVRHLGAGV